MATDVWRDVVLDIHRRAPLSEDDWGGCCISITCGNMSYALGASIGLIGALPPSLAFAVTHSGHSVPLPKCRREQLLDRLDECL